MSTVPTYKDKRKNGRKNGRNTYRGYTVCVCDWSRQCPGTVWNQALGMGGLRIASRGPF